MMLACRKMKVDFKRQEACLKAFGLIWMGMKHTHLEIFF